MFEVKLQTDLESVNLWYSSVVNTLAPAACRTRMHVFNKSLKDTMKPKLSIVCGQIDALTFVSGFLFYEIETTLLFVDIQKAKRSKTAKERRDRRIL